MELAGQLHGHRRAPGLAAGTSTSAAPRWLAVTLVVSGWLHQVRDLAATGFPKPFHQNCDLVIQETCELGYRFIVHAYRYLYIVNSKGWLKFKAKLLTGFIESQTKLLWN